MVPPRWTRWSEPRSRCQFADARAAENAGFLKSLLGDWIESGPSIGGGHLLRSHWTSGGADAFLHLNAVAEDMRLLQHTPGFASTLHDLKQLDGYEPTRHALRSAALFARAGARIIRLFEPSNESVPDFEVELDGVAVPVEAKQLTESERCKQFRAYSAEVERRLFKEVLTGKRNYPVFHVIVKDPEALPPIDVVLDAVRAAVRSFVGFPFLKRFSELNIQVTPDARSDSFTEYRHLHLLCPRSPKEAPRVARSAEKSNKQIRNHARDKVPGILCLGLTEHQDPHLVAEVLRRKFGGGQLRGISTVVLHRSADQDGAPMRCVIDLISTIRNFKALVPGPGRLPLKSIGIALDLFDSTRDLGAVSAYKRARVEGRIREIGGGLGLNIPRGLTPAMLA
jgi:hypothetical protein